MQYSTIKNTVKAVNPDSPRIVEVILFLLAFIYFVTAAATVAVILIADGAHEFIYGYFTGNSKGI